MSDSILVAREYGMQSYIVDVVVTVWVIVSVNVNIVILFVRDMRIPTTIMAAIAMFVTSLILLNYMVSDWGTNILKLIRRWLDEIYGMSWNVVVVLKKGDGSKKIWKYEDVNIVTDEGDKYYAQKAAGETPTNNFNTMYLGNGTQPTWTKASNYGTLTGAISGSAKTVSSGYPKTNDTDPDNTGGGLMLLLGSFHGRRRTFPLQG
jgi:hypothetical protein